MSESVAEWASAVATLLAVTAVADPFKKGKDSNAAVAKLRLTGEWRAWATTLQAGLVARRAAPRVA